MFGILIYALVNLAALQPAPASELIDPFATRPVRTDVAPAPSDLIDPFSHPKRRDPPPVDCSDSTLRDPFTPTQGGTGEGTFPGLRDPFARPSKAKSKTR